MAVLLIKCILITLSNNFKGIGASAILVPQSIECKEDTNYHLCAYQKLFAIEESILQDIL